MEKIINSNPKNEFVKTMAGAKDHHEFDVGMPKKEHTREFKNGFHNARALAKEEPELLDKMIALKELNKDFQKGLAAGKQEFKVRRSMARMKQEREQRQCDIDRDLCLVLIGSKLIMKEIEGLNLNKGPAPMAKNGCPAKVNSITSQLPDGVLCN